MKPFDFEWVGEHISDDPARLRLKYGRERARDILQIEMRRKHSAKFAETLRENPEFVFPTALSAEQATSNRLAGFHATLIEDGDRVADLTAGLGIDAASLARRAELVVAIERNEELAKALLANYSSRSNIRTVCGDCREVVKQWLEEGVRFDALFIDPARRDTAGGRVFALRGCEPDVVEMLPDLMQIAPKLIIKASPMLDITHSIGELSPWVAEVISLGTTTECKELDFICRNPNDAEEPIIRAVTISAGGIEGFEFKRSQEVAAAVRFGVPKAGDYVYDPYPSVMKAAPAKLIGERYNLVKLGSNTHLWFSSELVDDFPGQIFKAEEVLPYMSKHIKRYSSRYPRVSVTARNFDISAEALKAKLKTQDGPLRLFAVNAFDGRKLLITCKPIEV